MPRKGPRAKTAEAQRSPRRVQERRAGVRVRSPSLSPGLRQPPDSPLALLRNDRVEETAVNRAARRGQNGSVGENLRKTKAAAAEARQRL